MISKSRDYNSIHIACTGQVSNNHRLRYPLTCRDHRVLSVFRLSIAPPGCKGSKLAKCCIAPRSSDPPLYHGFRRFRPCDSPHYCRIKPQNNTLHRDVPVTPRCAAPRNPELRNSTRDAAIHRASCHNSPCLNASCLPPLCICSANSLNTPLSCCNGICSSSLQPLRLWSDFFGISWFPEQHQISRKMFGAGRHLTTLLAFVTALGG